MVSPALQCLRDLRYWNIRSKTLVHLVSTCSNVENDRVKQGEVAGGWLLVFFFVTQTDPPLIRRHFEGYQLAALALGVL